jgi:hypothetical protein
MDTIYHFTRMTVSFDFTNQTILYFQLGGNMFHEKTKKYQKLLLKSMLLTTVNNVVGCEVA